MIDILDILSPHRPFSFTATAVVTGSGRCVAALVYCGGGVEARVYVPGPVEAEVFA